MTTLNGKTIIISGGSRGIGEAIAVRTDFSKYRIGGREEDLQLDFWVEARFPAETPSGTVDARKPESGP
jgi:short-subunit dehydrogenase involved in D-alanine esterification of teichoic acids